MEKEKITVQNPDRLLTASWFIKYCQKRNIRINQLHLDFYKKSNLISPILVKDEIDYYDPYQIYIIGEIERVRLNSLELPIKDEYDGDEIISESQDWKKYIQENLEPLQKRLKIYSKKILPFLSSIEYKDNFDFENTPNKLHLTANEINNWRIRIFIDGQNVDPLGIFDWYVFMKNLKQKDQNKYSQIRGSALLAQDYYHIAELLTSILGKITKEKPMDLNDILDGTGGGWKERECKKCEKIFRIKNRNEKYCPECKKEVSGTTDGAWRCKKCDRVLYRYLDRNEIANNLFFHAKTKNGSKNNETYTRLEYGLLTLICVCSCGTENVKRFDYGWM